MRLALLVCVLIVSELVIVHGENNKSKFWWWSKGSRSKSKGKSQQEAVVHHYHHYVKGAKRPSAKRYVIVVPIKMNSPGYDHPADDYQASYPLQGYTKAKGYFKHRADTRDPVLVNSASVRGASDYMRRTLPLTSTRAQPLSGPRIRTIDLMDIGSSTNQRGSAPPLSHLTDVSDQAHSRSELDMTTLTHLLKRSASKFTPNSSASFSSQRPSKFR